MAGPSEVFGELVATTARHRDNKIVDNVANHNALLRYMKDHKTIETGVSGGTEIVKPLAYAENETYQRFYGGDILDVSDSDVITAAKYDWKQATIHVTATGRELLLNKGKEQLINLVKTRYKVAMTTAKNNVSVDLYSDGSADNQIGGLDHLIQSTGGGTVGAIDSDIYTFWKNKFQDLPNEPTFAQLKSAMNRLWLSIVNGMDKPDLILMTHDYFEIYEGGLQDLQRYGDSKAASLGFESLKYKTASVVFDDTVNFGTTAQKSFFLNTQYIGLQQHPDANWTRGEKKSVTNQDKTVVPIMNMCELYCTNRSRQGRLQQAA